MKTPQKNPLEWTVFGISLLLVLGIVGYLITAAVQDNNGVADLQIELGAILPQSSSGMQRFLIPVVVHNRGDQSAEDVRIEITLNNNGEELEKTELTIPLVPFNSSREGMVAFRTNPDQGVLSTRVVSFLLP